MRRSLSHMAALRDIGEFGDYSQFLSLIKKFKSHRDSQRISLGLAIDPSAGRRKREKWGQIERAKPEDDVEYDA